MSINNEFQKGSPVSYANSTNFFEFEKYIQLATTNELRAMAKNLNQLGMEFDPFSPTKNAEIDELIVTLGLEYFTEDPFQFTNIILKKLDTIETEIKKRNS